MDTTQIENTMASPAVVSAALSLLGSVVGIVTKAIADRNATLEQIKNDCMVAIDTFVQGEAQLKADLANNDTAADAEAKK